MIRFVPFVFLLSASNDTVTPSVTALGDTALAIGLLIAAVVLLLLEFLVVSYGLLAIAATAFAIAGIWIGFGAAPMVGWSLLVATPIIATAMVAWGFRRLQRSDLVPKTEITDDAGYRHATEGLGVTVGAAGVMQTPAMPTGRAKFLGGEIDVLVEGATVERGDPIVVIRIEGPTVVVKHAPPTA